MHTTGRGRAQITQQGAYSRGKNMGRTIGPGRVRITQQGAYFEGIQSWGVR